MITPAKSVCIIDVQQYLFIHAREALDYNGYQSKKGGLVRKIYAMNVWLLFLMFNSKFRINLFAIFTN